MKLYYLGLSRETLLERSKENRGKLIEEQVAKIKETIEEAVSRGLEGVIYSMESKHAHIKEDLIDIIQESGLTANAVKNGSFHSGPPVHEISISWKDESGIVF